MAVQFNIADFSLKFNKPTCIVGIRPGEKLHESLLSEEESAKSCLIENCFVVKDKLQYLKLSKTYSSNDETLSENDLKLYMDSFLEKTNA